MIDDYLSHKALRCGFRTIQQRRYQLQTIAAKLPVALVDVTENHILQWHATLRGKPETVASYVSAIRGLYRWMCVQARPRLRTDDPTALLERPHVPVPPPRPMADRHFDLAIACAASDPELWLWIGMMGVCGLRCCEIAWMQTHDIELGYGDGALMHVIGKGQKRRTVPLPPTLAIALGPFLTGGGAVFTRPSDGRQYQPKSVGEKTNRFLRSLRIHETAHTLRHRFGTDYHAVDVDMYRQAAIMGHSSVDTTRRYTEVDPTEAARYVAMLADRRFGRGQRRGAA